MLVPLGVEPGPEPEEAGPLLVVEPVLESELAYTFVATEVIDATTAATKGANKIMPYSSIILILSLLCKEFESSPSWK